MKHRSRRRNSGFALLLVFLMVAVVAISMYIEMPRVAFDNQRQKEQLLIERGEQYKRGIELFFKANKKYPATLDELENFNGRRFLRHRYKDPMTGKEEWRLVHIQNGMLTDSVTMKQQGRPGDQAIGTNSGQYISEAPIGNSGAGPGQGGAAMAQNRRRASDNAPPGGPGNGAMVDGGYNNPNPNDPTGANPGSTSAPGTVPPPGGFPPGINPVPGAQPGMPPVFQPGMPLNPNTGQPIQPGVPGQPFVPGQPGGMPIRGIPGQTGLPGLPTQGNNPGNTNPSASSGSSYMSSGNYMGGAPTTTTPAPVYPGQNPQYPGAPVNSQMGGVSPYQTAPGANMPGAPPFNQPGGTLNQGPGQGNAVGNLIGNILFNPRPGGPAAAAPGNTNGLGPTIGGGIAGIASTADADGIMLYNDRSNYKEWEFIFDPAKVKKIQNPNSGTVGTPANQMGSNPGTNPGTDPMQQGQMNPLTQQRFDGGYGQADPSIRAGRQ
jgi:hypothetical protein